MAGRPPTDPDLVARALAKVDALEETLGLGSAREEAAKITGVSVATIRRAQAARKALGSNPSPSAPLKASPRGRPVPRRGSPKEGPVKPVPLPPPPAPIPLLPDAVAELRGALEQTKGQLFALAGRQGYSAAGTLYDRLWKSLAALERERAKPGAELSAILTRGSAAIAKIRQGRATLAARELESGCCACCGGRLSEEKLAERRARAAG